jgi:polysaccharide pyruvyl transferase WcaK-like protein
MTSARLGRTSGQKTVCIIGNYSGRNAGDAAMLEGIMLDVRERFGDVRFTIPTINPQFIRNTYPNFNAEPVSALPWNGCVKFLGLPVWKAIRDADLVLVTDAILFDHGLMNPFKNYLSSLALLLPPAKARGVPVVLYNVSIGPVSTAAGRWCLRRVLEAADSVILRDEISRRTLARLGLVVKAHTGGDSALGAKPASEVELAAALTEQGVRPTGRPIVGFNMNAYGSAFLKFEKSQLSPDSVIPMLADTIRWIRVELGADVWIFSTQHMDETFCRRLQALAGADETPLFSNRKYSHRVILGLMSKLSMMVGMRTHSLILASSWGNPLVGMVTYPKTYGYLERVHQEKRSFPITQLTETGLRQLLANTWANREEVRAEVTREAGTQRRLSKLSVVHLQPFLETDAPVVPASAAVPVTEALVSGVR